MKLEKAALVAEIISGVAIVVTLIVLVIEVRDNTDAMRAATRESLAERVERITMQVATDADFSEILARGTAFASTEPLGELTLAETVQLRAFISALLRNSEEAYFQMMEGRLDEPYFEGRIQGALRVLSSGTGREIYDGQKANGLYDKRFTDRLDREIAERFGR